jgi:hypothetical protein
VIVDPTINPDGKITIYQPMKTAAEVELWQQGGFELAVSSAPVSNATIQGATAPLTGNDDSCPVEEMDDESITDLLIRIAEKLSK